MTSNPEFIRTLRKSFGFRLPPRMSKEFVELIQLNKKSSKVISPEEINNFFCKEYIENTTPFELTAINFEKEFVNTEKERLHCHANVKKQGKAVEVDGYGNGALNALANAFKNHYGIEVEVKDYRQHGLTHGSHALAASYILISDKNKNRYWGVGIDSDCTLSAIRALLSAVNRSQKKK